MKIQRTFACAAALTLCAGMAMAQDSYLEDELIHNCLGEIAVDGNGFATAIPDMAALSTGIRAEASTPEAAMSEVAEKMAKMIEAASASGLKPKQIQSNNISVSPVYSSGQNGETRKITHYAANASLALRDFAPDEAGTIMSAMVDAGSNGFNGLELYLADPAPLHRAARAMAVRDALDKTNELANAADMITGSVLRIVEPQHAGQPIAPVRMMADARSTAAIPIATGEITVREQVSISRELCEPAYEELD